MTKAIVALTLPWFALLACGTPGRPVGLPPPEFEEPRVDPWPASPPAEKSPAPTPSSAAPTAQGVERAPEETAGARGNGGGSASLPEGKP